MTLTLPSSQPQAASPMQAQTPVKAVPQSPMSPGAQARESERVTTMLDINSFLFCHIAELQSQGKTGTAAATQEGEKPKASSQEYVE